MQHNSSVSYWNDSTKIEPWTQKVNGGRHAAGITLGALNLQHGDPHQLRRVAEALNAAAFQLEIERARDSHSGTTPAAAEVA